MAEKLKAVIIGGGVAGLAAALRLGEGGKFDPLVLEREKEPGGLARSLHFKGVSTDLGPHRLHTELPEVEKLVSEICAPSIYTVKRKSRIYLRGKFLDYPPTVMGVTRHLGIGRMMRFGTSMALQKILPTPPNETYESIMRQSFGAALYDFMLRPYSKKVWKTDPSEIHPDTARVRVSAGSLAKMITRLVRPERKGSETALKEFRYVRGGVETLVRHLVEHAEKAGASVRVAKPVEKIELIPHDVPGRYQAVSVNCSPGSAGENERHSAEAVVSTVPLPVLLNDLLPEVEELKKARESASRLTYLNITFVLLIIKRKIISGDNWLYFPDPEFIFNRAYESKSFDPGMGTEDRSVLCIELTSRPGDAIDTENDDALASEVIRQITGTGLFEKNEIEEKLVYRLKYGYPLYSLDYHERLADVLDGLRAVVNLVSTGRQGLFNHNNTDHSILMGLRAAEAMNEGKIETLADRWYDTVDAFKHFRIVD